MKRLFAFFVLWTVSLSLAELNAQSSASIQLSSLWLSGEVSSENQFLNSLGFAIQKKLTPKSTLSFSLSQARTSGFDYAYWSHISDGGGLEGDVFESFKDGNKWFPNYVLSITSLKMDFEFSPFSKNDVSFKKSIDPFFKVGAGLARHQTNINILDKTNTVYQISEEDRILSINEIKRKFDETFETSLNQSNSINPSISLGIGVNCHVSNIWQVVVSAEAINLFLDTLDGISHKVDGSASKNPDILYLYQFEIRRKF